MGNLIKERVKLGYAFVKYGVDYVSLFFLLLKSGDLWEARLKTMKYLLRRVMGDVYFTYKDLLIIFTHAKDSLNNRLLTPILSNPNDLISFILSHFLIEDFLAAIPETDETSVPVNRLTRRGRVSQYSQNLWKRWGREYLSQL